jgi:hypothetical protein
MDPRDFHSLAVRLCSAPTGSPAEFRTAIGRSYYAVFNVAADHLRQQGFSIGKGAAAHGEVQKCLMNSADPAVIAVGTELSFLHTNRNRADYHLAPSDVDKGVNARRIVNNAGRVIADLDAAFRGPKGASIAAAISKWRRDNGYP